MATNPTAPLPANCSADVFLANTCAELPFSLENAEDLLAQLEPTPDEQNSDWMKLRSFVDMMQMKEKIKPEGVGYWNGQRFCGSSNTTILTFPLLGDLNTFNPLLTKFSNDHTAQGFLFTPLLRQDAADFSKPAPGLIEKIDHHENFTEFTLHFRRDVLWHDGVHKTADDFLFTFAEAFSKKALPVWRDHFFIDGQAPTITKIDDFTVSMRFAKPFPFLERQFVNLFLAPKHVFQGHDSNKMYNVHTPPEQVVGNGPFRLKDFQMDQRIVFVAAENYYRKDDCGTQLPYLQKAVGLFITKESGTPSFMAGDLHILDALPASAAPKTSHQPYVQQGPLPTTTVLYLYFNGHKAVDDTMAPELLALLRDPQFREVVDLLIPREYLAQEISQNPKAALDCYANEFDAWYQSCGKQEYSKEKAAELLAQVATRHQLKKNNHGIYQFPNEEPVKLGIMYLPTSAPRAFIANTLIEDGKKVGLEFHPDVNPAMNDVVTNPGSRWHIALQGFTNDPLPALSSEDTFCPGGSRWYPFPRKTQFEPWETEMRAWFNEMKTADEMRARELWHKIQMRHREQRWMIPIISAGMVHLANANICNIATNPYANPLRSNPEEWFWRNSRGECAPE